MLQFALAHLWGDPEVQSTAPRWKYIVALDRAKEQLVAAESKLEQAQQAAQNAEEVIETGSDKALSPISKPATHTVGIAELAASHRVVKLAASQSELVGVTAEGALVRWRWDDSQLELHPAAERLNLCPEDPICDLATSRVAGAVLTTAGNLAYWADPAIQLRCDQLGQSADLIAAGVERMSSPVPQLAGEKPIELLCSNQMFFAIRTATSVHTIGRVPGQMAVQAWQAMQPQPAASVEVQLLPSVYLCSLSKQVSDLKFSSGLIAQGKSASCGGMSISRGADGVKFRCTSYGNPCCWLLISPSAWKPVTCPCSASEHADTGKRFALATTGWNSGTHSWRVRLDDFSGSHECCACIGVGTRPVRKRTWEGGGEANGWYILRGYDGASFANGVNQTHNRSRRLRRGALP